MSDDKRDEHPEDDHLIFGGTPAGAAAGDDGPARHRDVDSGHSEGGTTRSPADETPLAGSPLGDAGYGAPQYVSAFRDFAPDGGYPQPPTYVEPDEPGEDGRSEPAAYATVPPPVEPPAGEVTPVDQVPVFGVPAGQPSGYGGPYDESLAYETPAYEQPAYQPPVYQPPTFAEPVDEASAYQNRPHVEPGDEPTYERTVYEQRWYSGQLGYDEQPNEPIGNYSPDSYPQPPAAPAAPDPGASFADPAEVEATIRRGDLPPYSVAAHRSPIDDPPPNATAALQLPTPDAPVPAATAPPAQPQGYGATAPAAPPRQPRPEDLLVRTRSDVTAAPASWGWRGVVNRGSGGLIKAKAAPAEVAAREAIVRIQRSFSRPMTVVVVQPKGGAGKTPTTICLSAAFGAHRGGYVVGWDDNETRGTLAVRVQNPDNQQATVWDLLSDLSAFERHDARVGDLSFYVRAQPDAQFDALVSDDNPANMAQIGDEAFGRLHRVLQRFYRMIVVDTGNNVRSANWQAAVNAADLVVVVSTYQRDVGFSASWVLDHLAQTGREELARNAVTVLTAADPTSDKQVRAELMTHFTQRTRAVVEIPYDPELAHGGPIGWARMQPATRHAWVEAGAVVADALTEQEQRVLAARRS